MKALIMVMIGMFASTSIYCSEQIPTFNIKRKLRSLSENVDRNSALDPVAPTVSRGGLPGSYFFASSLNPNFFLQNEVDGWCDLSEEGDADLSRANQHCEETRVFDSYSPPSSPSTPATGIPIEVSEPPSPVKLSTSGNATTGPLSDPDVLMLKILLTDSWCNQLSEDDELLRGELLSRLHLCSEKVRSAILTLKLVIGLSDTTPQIDPSSSGIELPLSFSQQDESVFVASVSATDFFDEDLGAGLERPVSFSQQESILLNY